MPATYDVIPADLARDRDSIIAVWQRNLTTDRSRLAEKFAWYYLKNPLGPARCWLLKSGHEVVGVAAVGLRRIRYRGNDLLAGLASDFAVDVAHRSFAPALMLQRTVAKELQNDLDLVYGLPNEKSLPIFKRLGYMELGKLHRQVKVLRTGSYIERRTRSAAAAAIAGPVIDLAMRTKSPETWRSTNSESGPISRFDAAADQLWQQAKDVCPFTAVRTSEFLNWRYADCPLRAYRCFGSAQAYAVTYDDGDQRTIADCFARSRETLGDLLTDLIKSTRHDEKSSLACESLGSTILRDAVEEFGFADREPTMPVVALARPGIAAEDFPHWYLLRGDEDYN